MATWRERIAKFFGSDREEKIADTARGQRDIMPTGRGSQMMLGGSSGYDFLQQSLHLNTELLARFIDYEEMDDYPELSCLAGDSLIFTLEWGWITIRELAERGGEFHVLAYDRERRSLVPARALNARETGAEGQPKPMVRVVFDDGAYLDNTDDHLYLTKDERWVEAADLKLGDRIMPGVVRMRSLNVAEHAPYWEVHQPHADSQIRSSDGKRWTWIHRLVGAEFLGAGAGEIVHHGEGGQLNNGPLNLSVESRSSHAVKHIAGIDNSQYFPEWTPEHRLAHSKRLLGNRHRRGKKSSAETRERLSKSLSGRRLSAEHRRRIGEANRIPLEREQVEAAFHDGGTVAEAARTLGVSWSVARRALDRFDLLADGGNHRVVRVERRNGDTQAVYDIEVPEYHNFVCNGVVVHNSSLDVYGDDATVPDAIHGHTVWAVSEDKLVRDILNDLYWRRLRIDEDIFPLVRVMCKYGNNYAEIVVTDRGVVGLNFMPVPSVRRVEDKSGKTYGFVQDTSGRFNISTASMIDVLKSGGETSDEQKDSGVVGFQPWQVVHWRLRSKQMNSPYGHSVLDPARWIWRRLVMMEDSVLVYKLTRSPARYAFYVDTGDLPPDEALAYVRGVKSQVKKKKIVNPQTGKLDFRVNPLAMDEDFWVPTRGGQESTRIDVISGPDYQGMEDVLYFRSKMLAAIKVPPSFLGLSEEGTTGKSSLAQEDVRFARTEMRVQRETRNGLRQVGRVHLAALGIDPDLVEWDVKMTVPSAIFELQQLEVMAARSDAATNLEKYMTKQWILTRIFGFSADDAAFIVQEKADETQSDATNDAATQAKIMQDYPELSPEQVGEAGEEGGEAPQQESLWMLRRELKLLTEGNRVQSQTNRDLVRRLDVLVPIVENVRREMRQGRGTRNQSR